MNNFKMSYEFPISNEFTITYIANNQSDLLKIINAKPSNNMEDIDSQVSDYVYRKLHDLACDHVLSERYKDILKKDAERRMKEDGLKDTCDVEALVTWCWENNAGHWSDGTPITDD